MKFKIQLKCNAGGERENHIRIPKVFPSPLLHLLSPFPFPLNRPAEKRERISFCAVVLAIALVVPGNWMYAVADSADAPAPAHKADQPVNEITPEQQVAVEKGLAFLASQQNAEGSFGNSVSYGATAAITARSEEHTSELQSR